MKIAYLGSDAFADLLETSFETDTDKQMAILAHSDVEFYSLKGFITAFNNEQISDLGYLVLCEDDCKTLC